MYEWEKMNAGDEIDKVVASRVGWDPKSGWWWYVDSDSDEGVNSLKSSICPKYSEDWRATGELVDFAGKSGFTMQIKLLSPGTYEACFTDNSLKGRHVQTGETAPLAIVKSFLKATEKRETSMNIC